jgi:hypothetical protein
MKTLNRKSNPYVCRESLMTSCAVVGYNVAFYAGYAITVKMKILLFYTSNDADCVLAVVPGKLPKVLLLCEMLH